MATITDDDDPPKSKKASIVGATTCHPVYSMIETAGLLFDPFSDPLDSCLRFMSDIP